MNLLIREEQSENNDNIDRITDLHLCLLDNTENAHNTAQTISYSLAAERFFTQQRNEEAKNKKANSFV